MASTGFNIVIWRSKTTNGECGEYGFIVPACLSFHFLQETRRGRSYMEASAIHDDHYNFALWGIMSELLIRKVSFI